MLDIREYRDSTGRSPFGDWLAELDSLAARKVSVAIYRVGLGNLSNTKSIGSGVHECRINFGPGYRVYFRRDGERIVILLAGGTKKRQQNDIRFSQALWQKYKQARKRQEEE
jgi:putative addiction module killer protein